MESPDEAHKDNWNRYTFTRIYSHWIWRFFQPPSLQRPSRFQPKADLKYTIFNLKYLIDKSLMEVAFWKIDCIL